MISAARTLIVGSNNLRPSAFGILRWPLAEADEELDYSLDVSAPMGDVDDTITLCNLSISPWGSGELSALTGTDPLLLMEVEPANAHEFVIRSAASSSLFDAARLHQFLCSAENRFFVLAYVSVSAARSGGQARSGATRSHAQRSTASMARIASTGP
jgi:hypothetical protein